MAVFAGRSIFFAGLLLGMAATATPTLSAPYMVLGLDQKLTWDAEGKPVYSAPGRDKLVIIDLARPGDPKIAAVLPLDNSIAGPPTNLAVSPDSRLALVASSVTNVGKPGGGFEQVSANTLFVIDLKSRRPKIVQALSVGKRPSGLSINSSGTLAMVAYRGETSVGVFRIKDGHVREIGRLDVGDHPSHLAFTPDGERVLVVKQDTNSVSVLDVEGEQVQLRRDISTSNGPYNVDVTPDGALGLVNDRGVIKVVNLEQGNERVTDTIPVDVGSEGLAISPRGNLAASVALRGSNGPRASAQFHERGSVVLLRIKGDKLSPAGTFEVGRVPEGVVFAPDGSHLYVANFYDENIWIFRVEGDTVSDTGKRLRLPGRPASARTVPAGFRADR